MPIRALVLVSVLVALFSLLNIGSGTYIAFSAIISLSSMSIYLSYIIVLACMLWTRLTQDVELLSWAVESGQEKWRRGEWDGSGLYSLRNNLVAVS